MRLHTVTILHFIQQRGVLIEQSLATTHLIGGHAQAQIAGKRLYKFGLAVIQLYNAFEWLNGIQCRQGLFANALLTGLRAQFRQPFLEGLTRRFLSRDQRTEGNTEEENQCCFHGAMIIQNSGNEKQTRLF